LKDGLRGSNFRDGDFFGEAWLSANKNSVVKFKDGSSRNRYMKVIMHEVLHELEAQGYTDLEVHDYDYKNSINNIEGAYRNLTKPNTRKVKINMLTRLVELYKQLLSKKI